MTFNSRENQFFSSDLYDIFSVPRHANSCLDSIYFTQTFYIQNYTKSTFQGYLLNTVLLQTKKTWVSGWKMVMYIFKKIQCCCRVPESAIFQYCFSQKVDFYNCLLHFANCLMSASVQPHMKGPCLQNPNWQNFL